MPIYAHGAQEGSSRSSSPPQLPTASFAWDAASSLCAHFNEVLKISYDSQVDHENTPSQIKNAMEMKESDEAVDLISKDEGFKKITTELNADVKNVTKK